MEVTQIIFVKTNPNQRKGFRFIISAVLSSEILNSLRSRVFAFHAKIRLGNCQPMASFVHVILIHHSRLNIKIDLSPFPPDPRLYTW